MKLGKVARLAICGLIVFFLAACGAKSPEDLEKNVLKDSYTGYSQESGYEYPFNHGGDTLVFDKSQKLITNSRNQSTKYAVLSEEQVKKIPPTYRGALVDLEDELKETDNFTIAIDVDDKTNLENAYAYYQVVLNNDGENIRVIELRRGYKEDDAYFDFSGVADETKKSQK